MLKIKMKRFFKFFFKCLLFLYVIVSLSFICYYVYLNYFSREEKNSVEEKEIKEEVEDFAEGKIYLNNPLIEQLYAYLPHTSSMYNLKDNLYQDFDQNLLKARAFELVEKADSEEKGNFILSETTLHAKVNDLYGNIPIKKESFTGYVTKPKIDSSITAIQCSYSANKYICQRTNTKMIKEDELKYIEYATKDEDGSIHIYERYIFFVKNNEQFDLYKDINKTEKITTITREQKNTYKIENYLEEYKSIPTYEHVFKKKGNHYYLYETKLKEENR